MNEKNAILISTAKYPTDHYTTLYKCTCNTNRTIEKHVVRQPRMYLDYCRSDLLDVEEMSDGGDVCLLQALPAIEET